MSSLDLQLKDYRLTLAEIVYHRPDHPGILQEFIWQDMDLAPAFPILKKFLAFWENNLDGRLHSVRIACAGRIMPGEVRLIGNSYQLN